MPDGRRLGVMHHEHIVVSVEQRGAVLVDLGIQGLLRLLQVAVRPLEGIVEGFGDRKKLGPAMDQPPVRRDPQRLQCWEVARQQLGYAAAKRRRVDVADPHPSQRPGQSHDLVEELIADQPAITVDIGDNRPGAAANADLW
jgi:hypothetical protein